MKSKKVLAVVSVFLVITVLILPYFMQTSLADMGNLPEVFPDGKLLSECKHLHMYDPDFGDLIEPAMVGSYWHCLYPESQLCHQYILENLVDSGYPSGNDYADVGEQIALREYEETDKWAWYLVEWVTVTIKVEHKLDIMYLDFNGTWDQWISYYGNVPNAVGSLWHEVYPVFSNQRMIIGHIDMDGGGKLSPGDQILLEGEPFFRNVDEVSTDIIVSLMDPRNAITDTGTYFEISPPTNIYEAVGGAISVDILINNAPATYAWEINLKWDTSVLNVTGIAEGTWFDNVSPLNVFTATGLPQSQAAGSLTASCTFQGLGLSASGNGLLCSVTFDVMADGVSALDLYNTVLLDTTRTPTYYPNNDGFFCSVAAQASLHDVAITNIAVSPTTVSPGGIVNIDVTVINQGFEPQHMVVKVYADFIDVYAEDPDIVLIDEVEIDAFYCLTLDPGAFAVQPFIWNTAGYRSEAWTISAEVIKTDAVDADPHDNLFIDGEVHVKYDLDLKVTNVGVRNPVVVKGGIVIIDVDVENQGTLDATGVDLTVYADGTKIDETTGLSLLSQTSTTVTTYWDTSGFSSGTYTITANVSTTWNEGTDKEPVDNELTDGTVTIDVYDVAVLSFEIMTTWVRHGYRLIVKFTLKNVGVRDVSELVVHIQANMERGYKLGNGTIRHATGPKPTFVYSTPGGYLAPGQTREYCIIWDTGGIPPIVPNIEPGMYNMSVTVQPLPEETNTANNYYEAPTKLIVTSVFDINPESDYDYWQQYPTMMYFPILDTADTMLAIRSYGSAPPCDNPPFPP